MQTTHISISDAHIHTYLPHTWTRHCPQYNDIKINGEEKEELKSRGRRKRRRVGMRNMTALPSP